MKYYLSSAEALPPTNNDEPVNKKPRTDKEYRMSYVDVLPSPKTISKMKHIMALQEERNAALAMLDATPDEVSEVKSQYKIKTILRNWVKSQYKIKTLAWN